MKTMGKRVCLAWACALLGWASCGPEDSKPPGSISLQWRFGGKSCSDFGVVEVRVSVRKDKEDVLNPPPTFPCEHGASGVVLEDVPAGTYTLALEGLTATGRADYQGIRNGVRVESGKETVVSPPVNLELKKSEVLLNWEFLQGTGHCNGNRVQLVQVIVFDRAATPVYDAEHPCILPRETYPELGVLVKDVRGNEELTFLLYGLNYDTPPKHTHYGETNVTTVPGERSNVNVLLRPCTAPGQCP